MSDYISKNETIKALRNYAEQKHCGGETVLANGILKAVCFIEKEENIPTVDETEIIRKAFERVVARLEECKKTHEKRLLSTKLKPHEKIKELRLAGCYINAIEIVKEECGINE